MIKDTRSVNRHEFIEHIYSLLESNNHLCELIAKSKVIPDSKKEELLDNLIRTRNRLNDILHKVDRLTFHDSTNITFWEIIKSKLSKLFGKRNEREN